MDISAYNDAYCVAMAAADPSSRRQIQKNRWDRANIKTASTRLRLSEDIELRRLCRAAGYTRYQLIGCMLRTWMAARRIREGE